MRRSTTLLSIVALVATMIPALPSMAQVSDVAINEIRIDQPSTDIDEYFELVGPAGQDLTGLTYVVIGDGAATAGSGVIEAVVDLAGESVDSAGFFVAAEGTFTLGTANSTGNLNFENSDNVTHLLVEGFSGVDGDDLDTDDDGILDTTPWTSVVDSVALIETVGSGELVYSSTQVGPDGSFVPGHVFVCDGTWQIGQFDPVDGQDTPGAANDCGDPGGGDPSACVFINEIHYDNTGADEGEAIEVAGTPGSLDGYSLVFYNGNGGAVSSTVALSGELTDQQDGYGTAVFEESGIQNGAPDGVALVAPDSTVLQFLSYEGTFTAVGGPADGRLSRDIGVEEPPSTPVGESLQLVGAGVAGDWTGPTASSFGSPNDGQVFDTECPTPEPAPTPECTVATIPEIQGAQHISPFVGEYVCATGVVTAVDSGAGFYLQDPAGDGDIATSDAIFVFDFGSAAVAVGDEVTVEGFVSENIPGGASTRNLSTTEISANSTVVNSSGNPLPDPVVIGKGGRLPPTEVIDDDAFASFDPVTDGLDFMESMEAMRVTVRKPTTVAGTSQFGELYTLPYGVRPTQESRRGTLNISPDDYNPERVQIDPDSGVFDIDAPVVDTGARLSDVTGVVGYAFGFFEVIPTEPFSVVKGSRLREERTYLGSWGSRLTVATYNVLNLDPNDSDGDTDVADGRFESIARDIVRNLRSPDIVALQEIQDNSGITDDGTVSADVTLQMLVDAIAAQGGPDYEFLDNPFIGDNTSGGQPGANIRVAFLYNPKRVDTRGVVDTVVDPADQQVNPANPFWDTRLPLVQTFEFKDRDFTLVNNHFASKSGSAPLYGSEQNSTERQEDPTVNGSLDERQDQAAAVNAYLAPLFAEKANVIVLGDFNEFEFISPLQTLSENLENLTLREKPDERYSYLFEGNSQSLDHILVSERLSKWAKFDPVHINAEFAATATRSSDHDPLLASISVLRLPRKAKPSYTLYVLHNNDGESDLLPDDDGAGSISRFGELVQDERRHLERGWRQGVVTVTAGDNFLASPELSASFDKGVPYYDSIALDYLDYDAFTIGNHEFDFGPEVLANFISGIEDCERTPFMTANLIFDGEPALDALVDQGCIVPSTVILRDGRKIGLIGLTTPELREVSSPGDIGILTNLAEIANAEAQKMTDDGIEIILLASHLQNLDNEVDLAASLTDIDAMIGGGGGEELAQARTAMTADGKKIPIVTVPGDYFDVGRLELAFDRDGNLMEFDWDLVPVTGDLDQDWFLLHKVEQPVADYVAALDEVVIVDSPVGLNGVRADVRTMETNLGNLMADSFVDVAKARAGEFGVTLGGPIVGLQNGGGIRNDSIIGPGNVTLLDTFDIAPFTNFVSVITDVSPADLVTAVEHGLSQLPAAEGSFGQWSGLVVEYDPDALAGSRIVNLTVNGTPYVIGGSLQSGLDPVDLATIDFLAAGNDGYDVFETYEFTRLGTSYQQSLADFLGTADLSLADYQEGAQVRIIPIP